MPVMELMDVCVISTKNRIKQTNLLEKFLVVNDKEVFQKSWFRTEYQLSVR